MSTEVSTAARRGRPAAASREDLLEVALDWYLRGRRVDVQALAAELGLGRTTIYRWFGSRDRLIGEVLNRAAGPVLDEARAGARGKGAALLLDIFDRAPGTRKKKRTSIMAINLARYEIGAPAVSWANQPSGNQS